MDYRVYDMPTLRNYTEKKGWNADGAVTEWLAQALHSLEYEEGYQVVSVGYDPDGDPATIILRKP